MQEQNFKNHSRILPSWHFGVYGLILAFIVGAARNLYLACEANEDYMSRCSYCSLDLYL